MGGMERMPLSLEDGGAGIWQEPTVLSLVGPDKDSGLYSKSREKLLKGFR